MWVGSTLGRSWLTLQPRNSHSTSSSELNVVGNDCAPGAKQSHLEFCDRDVWHLALYDAGAREHTTCFYEESPTAEIDFCSEALRVCFALKTVLKQSD